MLSSCQPLVSKFFMSRRQLVEQTLRALEQLPDDKVSEVADFAAFVVKRHEETIMQKGIKKLVESSNVFAFLHDEDDLYTLNDLKERF